MNQPVETVASVAPVSATRIAGTLVVAAIGLGVGALVGVIGSLLLGLIEFTITC